MSNDIVIRAEGLGKKYVIGHEAQREQYVALRDVIARGARSAMRKAADMAKGRIVVPGDEMEEFWALKNVGFELKRGEVLGIIGRNGAGKSTLLKILSRITEPTEGRVTIKGRVASLLEVGTGFHPELTGRENVYLNGAILGMKHAEIKRKFDEIVAFAEVERFLDTPVKRYSSGMYVRLAFAVAAHLEPEILIVDEVLAVGDAEFQKKCLGKMQDVAGHGRTVLFVSHNMAAIQRLCPLSVLLRDGRVKFVGSTAEAIDRYLAANTNAAHSRIDLERFSRQGEGNVRFKSVSLWNAAGMPIDRLRTAEPLIISLALTGNRTEPKPARLGITFYDSMDTPLFLCANEASCKVDVKLCANDEIRCSISRLPLSAGRYRLGLFLEQNGVIEDWLQDYIDIEVEGGSYFGTSRNLPAGWEGKTVLVDNQWSILPSGPRSSGEQHECGIHV